VDLLEEAGTLNEFINDNTGYDGDRPDLSFISVAETLYEQYIDCVDNVSHEVVTFFTMIYKRALLLSQEFIIKGYLKKIDLDGLLVHYDKIIDIFDNRSKTLCNRLKKVNQWFH